MRSNAIALLLAILTTTAEAQGVVEVSLNDFKPMAYEDDGEMKGFDVDLLEAGDQTQSEGRVLFLNTEIGGDATISGAGCTSSTIALSAGLHSTSLSCP